MKPTPNTEAVATRVAMPVGVPGGYGLLTRF